MKIYEKIMGVNKKHREVRYFTSSQMAFGFFPSDEMATENRRYMRQLKALPKKVLKRRRAREFWLVVVSNIVHP